MIKRPGLWELVCVSFLFIGIQCTDFEYANEIDIKGKNRDFLLNNPGALLDTVGGKPNGIADYFENEVYHPKDSIAPVITLPGGDTVRIPFGSVDQLDYYLKDVKATDAGGGHVTVLEPQSDVNVFQVSAIPYTIVYTVIDTSDNRASVTRYVFVYRPDEKDITKPVITILETTVYVQKDQPFVDPGVTAWDSADGAIPSNKIQKSSTVDVNKVGQYKVTYTVTDAAGNTGTAVRTVIVQEGTVGPDTAKPVITLKGADTIYLAKDEKVPDYMTTYKEPGYTATDTKDGDLTSQVKVGTIAQLNGQIWYLTYDVRDSDGNAAKTVKRLFKTTFTVDVATPIIDLEFPDSIFQLLLVASTGKAKWVEPGYTATDPIDNDITNKVIVDSSELVANLSKLGTYYVTYSVTNSSGIKAEVKRRVLIVDNPYDVIKPVITLKGRNPDTVLVQSATAYADPGYTAIDNKDGDITAKVTKSGTVNMKSIGKNQLTYSVKDAASNSATVSRVVWVVRDTLTTDLLIRYNVPSEKALPNMENKVFTDYEIDGEGPDLSKITKLNFSWSLTNKSIYNFQFTFSTEPYNKSFNSVTNNFGSAYPAMTLTGTGVTGLDGKYYVSTLGDEFYWVEQTGKFAIIWK